VAKDDDQRLRRQGADVLEEEDARTRDPAAPPPRSRRPARGHGQSPGPIEIHMDAQVLPLAIQGVLHREEA